MITESVKTILGEDLSNQVRSGLEGKGQGRKGRGPGRRERRNLRPRPEKYNGANSGKNSAGNSPESGRRSIEGVGGSGDPAKIARRR